MLEKESHSGQCELNSTLEHAVITPMGVLILHEAVIDRVTVDVSDDEGFSTALSQNQTT